MRSAKRRGWEGAALSDCIFQTQPWAPSADLIGSVLGDKFQESVFTVKEIPTPGLGSSYQYYSISVVAYFCDPPAHSLSVLRELHCRSTSRSLSNAVLQQCAGAICT